MKVCITFFALVLCAHWSVAQQKVEIKPQFLAEKNYALSFKGYIEYEVTLNSKSPVPMLKLEEAGMKFPLRVVEATSIKATATTGSITASQQTPLSVKYDQAKLLRQVSQAELADPNDNTIKPLAGKAGKATINAKGKIKIETIDDVHLAESDINRQDMINFFKLPEGSGKDLQPGDTYTRKDALNLMDIGPTPISVKRECIYKLISLTDGKAYFDIVQKISGNFTNDARFTAVVTGNGTGKMTFDLEKKMPSELSNELDVKISMPFMPTASMEIIYHSVANNILKID
ncbi:hypothetical protein MUGA111182_19960 [Mucilaginibacter galii]|uniref:DUF3108 domain-containing protein n=1 Tax=Mucilaginibacter galii TaxID=2005073 RepID=A0A917JBX2_9SPHI|nr:hypothetical protein [Mucilaginibacter galii]GGI52381.1 hypothetical protein GCM10011425_35930 [Mucilaginibacter galii]